MEKSEFQFDGYLIKKSIISIDADDVGNLDLSISFNPSAVLDKAKSTFKLLLEVAISDIDKKLTINISSEGFFIYKNINEDGLNNFLYLNAPAILFPYIRAYISSLTTLSGISSVILPTLNLSSLKEDLEKNITILE